MKALSGLAASFLCPVLVAGASFSSPASAQSTAEPAGSAAVGAPQASASAPAPTAAPTAAPANPHAVNPHANPHADPSAADRRGLNALLVTGSPFGAAKHRQQAELARSGRKFQPESTAQPAKIVPSGTVAVLVTDGENTPLAGKKVQLHITRQSIATGDQMSREEATTNADGLARFEKLNNESSFLYEALVEESGATYPSGSFRLERDFGHIVKLVLYPSTTDINQTFIVSRALYVIEPRAEVFQIQCLLRIHNTNPVTWAPGGLDIQLPKDWQAFSPGETTGDLKIRQTENRVVIDGTFSPGQHDFSFGFQLPNEQTETAHLTLPTTPHLVDARVFLTASADMGLLVEGFEPSEPARGNDGQHALLTSKDFLQNAKPPPAAIHATVTGMPTAGWGSLVAYFLAGLIGLSGIVLSATREQTKASTIAAEDRDKAKELLLGELVALEKSFQNKDIGPKTHAQTKSLLLDALARLEAS